MNKEIIKLDNELSREMLVTCKDENSKKIAEDIFRDMFCENPDFNNFKIQIYSDLSQVVHVRFYKGIEIPDITMIFRDYCVSDYIKNIRIICYRNVAETILHSLDKQLHGNPNYVNGNIILYNSYDIKNDIIGQTNIIFKNGCKNLPDIVIKGEYKMSRSYLDQKIFDYMMETSGEILELIEDEDIPNYVSDTLNYIASNMAEFANNILKESMMKEDILKENVENIINIANNLYDSTNIKTNNYIEKIGELIDEYKKEDK